MSTPVEPRPEGAPTPRLSRAMRSVAAVAATVALSAVPAVAEAAPCWQPPVVAPVIDPFRPPACRWCPGNRGIEYSTRPGTSVRAVAAGTVSFAGSVAGTRYVVVVHADGWRATYGDLARTEVGTGDVVVARSVVGVAGSRLHFGVRDGSQYLDPTPYLGAWAYRVRLVPLDGSPPASAGRARLTCGR